ncbi:MAG TPA: ArsR family transcriptional regulator [Dehalococcoidia bacterium]|nr:ArsR family transcriptional regulator [Dehalococcoidia bacterium]
MINHRVYKNRFYVQFARIGQALASERRLELLDLLGQGPRHVEALAAETGMSVASVSQHLQVLHAARLVEADRQGTRSIYRLAEPKVLRLWLSLRSVAESRLAEMGELRREMARETGEQPEVSRGKLEELIQREEALLLDVRPRLEYEHGHLPGAVSLPLEELASRVEELPRDRPIVTYCRGAYCLFADEAATLLRQHGFTVYRLEGGWPEWLAEGRPVG